MRILHTIDSLGIYGAETVLLNLAAEQQKQGHAPVLLSIGNLQCSPKAIELEATGRGLECIPFRMRDGLNLKGAAALLRAAEEMGADVIHSHGYKTNILLGMSRRSVTSPPVVTTLHGWTAKRAFSKLGLYRLVDQRLLQQHDAVVLVNAQMRNLPVIRAIPQNNVFYIPNGIAFDATSDSARENDVVLKRLHEIRGTGAVLIGAVGRLSPEKNFGALIEALSRLPQACNAVKVVILGTGPEEPLLRALIDRHRCEDRTWLAGYVTNARAYLKELDVLAIPSLTEGLPMILLEAMAAEVPIISTAVGDIPDTLAGCGTLVPPGDVDALVAAIENVTSNMSASRDRASAARQRVHEHFSAATMAARYLDVYKAKQRR